MDNAYTRYRIEDRSYVAFIRREIHLKAVAAKFSETDTGKIDIIVAELTSNLIKHVGSGEILFRFTLDENGPPIFEILCIDSGNGIDDTSRVMVDGVSTSRTLGQGLGSLDRQSTVFQIFSIPKWGTVLYSRVGGEKRDAPKTSSQLEVKALCVPKATEEVCGDGYLVITTKTHIKIFFGDGLGHGPHAKEAVDTAARIFASCEDNEPVDIIRAMHENVRRTRGLVGVVAVFDRINPQWSLCGVGNIVTRMYSGIAYDSYMSYNGTIGLNIAKSMKSSVIAAERNQHLIACSDGILARWDMTKYASIFKFDSNILAGAVYKDFNRGNDDASILIAKVI